MNGLITQIGTKNQKPTDVSGIMLNENNLLDFYITGKKETSNNKLILNNLGILLDGKYRETLLEDGIYNYIEKFVRTKGNGDDGLYCYNFCLNTDEYQPSGAINMSHFNKIEFQMNINTPDVNPMQHILKYAMMMVVLLVLINQYGQFINTILK